jgi:hypothetical protein
MDMELNPQLIIEDLLDQIKRLTLDNSMLRAYINANSQAQVSAAEDAEQ